MSIEKFMKSVMVDDLQNYIIGCFDEVMALYDLIGSYHNITVYPDQISERVKFDLKLSTDKLAEDLKTIIDRMEISKYGHIYSVTSYRNGDTLNIELIDRACG